MERLVSSSEAANILGLSLQGVHYRIKTNKLKSIKKDGKFFVYIDDNNSNNAHNKTQQIDNIVTSKNEQITTLKKSLKWMRKQYTEEISRLERNQEKIIEVFQSEISLLQSAFNEMRNIYKIENKDKSDNFEFLDIKEFFSLMKTHNKSNSQIKEIILNKVKEGDKRFIYNKSTKEVLIYKSDFLDLL